MAKESPLFQSALELFGHAITHFNGGTQLDRKLAVLHFANAVELLLKDLVLDQGISIYKNPKETVSVHGAVQALQGAKVNLPQFHRIELLIEERNALQHRFGSPDELTTLYYAEATFDFFQGALLECYGLDIEEVLPQFVPDKELAAFRLRKPTDETELEKLKTVARIHPSGALLAAYSYMERMIRTFLAKVHEGEDEVPIRSLNVFGYLALEEYGIELGSDLAPELKALRVLRNVVAHGRKEPTQKDVVSAVETIEKLEHLLDSFDSAESLRELLANREERSRRRRARAGRAEAGVGADAYRLVPNADKVLLEKKRKSLERPGGK